MTAVNLGDLFSDNDSRLPEGATRIVRVVELLDGGELAKIRCVEHWDETRTGKVTRIRLDRLTSKRWQKVSH